MAHFREQGQGILMINTSIGGRMAFPYFGYYNATKHALEASYEALWYECLGSNIKIKIIEPGFTQTRFATHGMQMSGETSPPPRPSPVAARAIHASRDDRDTAG